MKILKAVVLGLVLLVGCTTLPGQAPDVQLIEDAVSVSAYVVVGKLEKRGFETREYLPHINNVKQLVKETPEGQVVDLSAINSYLDKYVPADYEPLASLTSHLIRRRVEPILNSELSDSEKAKQVVEIIGAVLNGLETAITLYHSV